jgi:hypothetical protein
MSGNGEMAFNIRENGDTLTWVIDASKVYLQRSTSIGMVYLHLTKEKYPMGLSML